MHRRCRPAKAYLHKGYANQGDLQAGVDDVIGFTLYQERGVFEAEVRRPQVPAGQSAISDTEQPTLFSSATLT